MGRRLSFFETVKRAFIIYSFLIFVSYTLYYIYWGRHLYLVTAYCGCPICVNIPKYQKDNQFASGRKVYWGGIAADPKIRFRSKVELVPHWPQDWGTVLTLLKGRRNYVVEDRGGKIRGKHIDIYIPDSMGGHKAARRWGVRRMRIKINGEWAE